MLKPEKIDIKDFNIRGKWNINAMTEWIQQQANQFKNQAIAVDLMSFYREFYNGSKVIKYIGYYSRKHLLECMKKLNIAGQVTTSKNRLMISFRK